ncbi:Autophagy protein 7 [Mitosporidium daphniae]
MGSFVLPSLQIDPISFWSSLHHLKLERFKLEEGPFPLWGFLDVGKSHAFVKLDANSFLNKEQANLDADAKHSSFAIPGHLLVSNTFSNYKSGSWKKSALSSVSKIVWEQMSISSIQQGDPFYLLSFVLFVYADLKAFNYKYSYVFPAFFSPKILLNHSLSHSTNFILNAHKVPIFFCATSSSDNKLEQQQPEPDLFTLHPLSYSHSCEFAKKCANFDSFFFGIRNDVFIPFKKQASSFLLSWPIRNYIILLYKLFRIKEFRILPLYQSDLYEVFHENGAQKIKFHASANMNECFVHVSFSEFPCTDFSAKNPEDLFALTGWQTESNGLVKEFAVNFSDYCNPMDILKSSLSLNLNLMKWRVLPDLNLERLSSQRVLICGAGTLGCNIARALLSLYSYSTTMGSSNKAEMAAQSLTMIYPLVNSKGIVMNIPTLGQCTVSQNEIQELEAFVVDADVLFLVTDTRESRWLPSVLGGAAFDK